MIDPRTPVIVGVGQVNVETGDAPEPVELLAEAAREAARDANAPSFLVDLDSIRLVRILTRRYDNPAAKVAKLIGATPAHTAITTDGGHSPQMLINRSATDIQRGSAQAVLIGGAEAWRTRVSRKARDISPTWPIPTDVDEPADEIIGDDRPMVHEREREVGLELPVTYYSLFENAIRAASDCNMSSHSRRLGVLWSRFSEIAVDNKYAAVRGAQSAEAVRTISKKNRIVAFPYSKLLCANSSVDQAAAVLMCSAEYAHAHGIPRDRWVFLHSGAEASDTQFVSNRVNLHSSPAINAVGRVALSIAGLSIDDLAYIDLYSCFPSAVQIAANELGIPPERDLTVTGGLTFAGGPWNNYSTHAIATMVGLLREDPREYGLCTANGGLLTKHAMGIYSARPRSSGTRIGKPQQHVDARGSRGLAEGHEGRATVESYTVIYGRDGEPERAILACDVPDGRRTWAYSSERSICETITANDPIGCSVEIAPGGLVDSISGQPG